MKKYLALLLALMMVLFCTACGGKTASDEGNPPPDGASEPGGTDTDGTGTGGEDEAGGDELGPVLADAVTGEGFACIVLDNSESYWAVGLTDPEDVYSYFSIRAAPATYIEFVPLRYTGDPVTDPDAVWQMRIIDEEIPDWFLEDEEFQQIAWNCLEEWRAVAYTAEPVVAVHAETIAIPEETGEGFACVLRKDGKVFWEAGVNSPSQLVEMNGLENVSKLLIQVVQTGEGDNSWQIQIIGDTIPTWFTSVEAMEFNVRDALEEWRAATEEAGEDAGAGETPSDLSTSEEEN